MNKWPDDALVAFKKFRKDGIMFSSEGVAADAFLAGWLSAATRVRELENREAELTELLKKTDVLFDQLEASDELSESYEAGIAEVHLPIIVALKGTP